MTYVTVLPGTDVSCICSSKWFSPTPKRPEGRVVLGRWGDGSGHFVANWKLIGLICQWFG